VSSFVPISQTIQPLVKYGKTGVFMHNENDHATTQLKSQENDDDEEALLNRKFEEIALKLRVGIHTPGFVSKDPLCGIENIRVSIPVEPSLGLELVEVAHSTTDATSGLVLVRGVSGNAAAAAPKIQPGDTLVRVLVAAAAEEPAQAPSFQDIVTGKDYETTMDAIIEAKAVAQSLNNNNAAITLEFNRLVERASVEVIVEGVNDKKPIIVQGNAGDNLRLLLQRNKLDMVNSSSSHCGGEGICGTCRVRVLEGQELLNKPPPSKKGGKEKDPALRLACQTVVGANNEEGTVRISLA